MNQVSVRELRNHGGEVLDRVARGETLTVTRGGVPVAQLRPLARQPVTAGTLLDRWRQVPDVDPASLRADLDQLLESAL